MISESDSIQVNLDQALPEGWHWKKLVDICEILMGQSPPSSTYNEQGIGLPFYQGKAEFGPTHPTPKKWCSAPQRVANAGDILMSVRAPVGPVNITESSCCIGRGLSALRPQNDMSLWFLFRYLQSIEYKVASLGQGSTFASISREDVENIHVPVPPLAEQERIAKKLELVLDQMHVARTALDRVPALLKAFRQSVLAAAFRGELTGRDPADEPASVLLERIRAERRHRWEQSLRAKGKDPAKVVYEEPPAPDPSMLPELPEGWVWSGIGGIFDVTLGGTPARDKPEYWNGEIPWVSSGEVAFCRITHTKETITQFGLNNSNAKFNPAGSVLLAMIGEGKTRGQAAVLDIDATTNQNIAAIHCTSTPVKAEWLFFWFMYKYEEVRGGGMGGAQPALNAGRVKALIVPIAPCSEMDRIIAKVTKMLAEVDTLEEIVACSLDVLDRIEQISLSKAFRGEL